jgi:hypothetical protein
MIGANRVLRGVAITNLFGDEQGELEGQRTERRRMVERALAMLEADVGPKTVWEAEE